MSLFYFEMLNLKMNCTLSFFFSDRSRHALKLEQTPKRCAWCEPRGKAHAVSHLPSTITLVNMGKVLIHNLLTFVFFAYSNISHAQANCCTFLNNKHIKKDIAQVGGFILIVMSKSRFWNSAVQFFYAYWKTSHLWLCNSGQYWSDGVIHLWIDN